MIQLNKIRCKAGTVNGSWDDMINGMVGGIRVELKMVDGSIESNQEKTCAADGSWDCMVAGTVRSVDRSMAADGSKDGTMLRKLNGLQ
jgi:hypothetical protein